MSNDSPLEIKFQLRSRPVTSRIETVRLNSARLPQITRVLALAIYFEDMIRRRDAKDYADIGRLSCLCRERVSQVMRLTYLAPEIQMELLYLPPAPNGNYAISETAARKIANLLSWDDQRREWAQLKKIHQLG